MNFILNEFELSKSINSEDVIKNSISTLYIAMSVQIWIDQWFNREFNHANQHFNVALIKLKFNELGLYSQKFEIKNTVDSSDSFIFFDPPYFNQGSNLYYTSFNEHDHQTMANKILELNDFFWITTYDVSQEIKEDYSAAPQKYLYKINYSANNKKRGKAQEYLFASNNLNVKTIQNIKLESFD